MFETIKISDKDYKQYKEFINNELKAQTKANIEKNSHYQLEINRLKSQKEEYIEKNMHMNNRDKEEERIYQSAKARYDTEIDFLRKQMAELDQSERDYIKEFEIFVKILQKAPQYFRKASYVQKRKITDLTISNITITAKKRVKITVLP